MITDEALKLLESESARVMARADLTDQQKLRLMHGLIGETRWLLAAIEPELIDQNILIEQALDAFDRYRRRIARADLSLDLRLRALLQSGAARDLAQELEPRLHQLARCAMTRKDHA